MYLVLVHGINGMEQVSTFIPFCSLVITFQTIQAILTCPI